MKELVKVSAIQDSITIQDSTTPEKFRRIRTKYQNVQVWYQAVHGLSSQ